jgi:hypothetical protein
MGTDLARQCNANANANAHANADCGLLGVNVNEAESF